jgi:hypothetical protein
MDMQRNDETGVRGLVETAVYERRTTIWCIGGWKLRGVSEDITRGGRRRAREQEMYFMAK